MSEPGLGSRTMHGDDGPDYAADDPIDMSILAERIHKNAVAHGFWPPEGRNFGEMIALIHSEASEALEEHRSGKESFYTVPQAYGPDKPEGTLVELADVIIRCLDVMFDLARKAGDPGLVDIAVLRKIKFNESRPYKHGRNY